MLYISQEDEKMNKTKVLICDNDLSLIMSLALNTVYLYMLL